VVSRAGLVQRKKKRESKTPGVLRATATRDGGDTLEYADRRRKGENEPRDRKNCSKAKEPSLLSHS